MTDSTDTGLTLIQAGKAGYTLIQDKQLPEDLFPPNGTWNDKQFLDAHNDPRQVFPLPRDLQANQYHGWKSNSSGLLQPPTNDLHHSFLKINGQLLRSSNADRLFSNTERYNLQPRLGPGGCLMVVRVRRADNTTTPPLLIITGPTATFQPDGFFETTQLSPDPSNPMSPLMPCEQDYPTVIAPMLISLCHNSRDFTKKVDSSKPCQGIVDLSCPIVIPDARPSQHVPYHHH